MLRACIALIVAALALPAQAKDPIVITMQDVVPLRGFPNIYVDWVSSRYLPALFDALTEVAEGGEIRPALAIAWRAKDPLTWEFDLREGVSFSNGEPFNADAVIQAIAFLQSDEAVSFPIRRHVRNIAVVERLTDHKIVIRTMRPDAMLPARLRTVRMVPPKYFAAVGRIGFAKVPHGTGPFMAQQMERTRTVLVVNPNAWRKPQWDELHFVPVGDAIARTQAVISGAADIAFNTGPSIAEAIEGAGARLLAYDIGSVDAVPFVTTMDTPLKDKRVRQALNYAVNKGPLIAAFVHGATSPATQFAPLGTFGYTANLPPAYAYDPAKAKALLKDAGYPNGFETAIELWTDGTEQAAIHQQIVSDLAAVGVKVRIIQVPILQWQNEGLYGGKWEAPMFNFAYNAMPTFDALEALETHSCLWAKPFNCDRAMADKIVEARETSDREVRLAKTRALFAALLEDPAAILLFPSIRFDVAGARMLPYAAPFGLLRFQDLAKRPK